jgi:hypothetical protein
LCSCHLRLFIAGGRCTVDFSSERWWMRVESSILRGDDGVGCFCGLIWLSLRLIEAHGLDLMVLSNFFCVGWRSNSFKKFTYAFVQ